MGRCLGWMTAFCVGGSWMTLSFRSGNVPFTVPLYRNVPERWDDRTAAPDQEPDLRAPRRRMLLEKGRRTGA